MIAVIMQPTYLPWMGYFDLMDQSDVFVFLDTVQFEKQAWQQRNRIKVAGDQSKWLTIPVVQNLGQKISEVKIDTANPWRRKHWGTIEQYYKRAPYWKAYSGDLAQIYARDWEYLVDLNIAIISFLKHSFGIKTQLLRTSQMSIEGSKVRLLTNICQYLKADTYISPVRAAEYIEEDNIFAVQGIALRYHQYDHPVYAQLFSGFLSYMSAVDLLFNEGPKSLEIIRSGRLKCDPKPRLLGGII